jgi:hypothetical protein
MELITPPDPSDQSVVEKELFGTAMGFSEDDLGVVVRKYLLALYPYKMRRAVQDGHGALNIRRDLSCDKLFDQYQRTLAEA